MTETVISWKEFRFRSSPEQFTELYPYWRGDSVRQHIWRPISSQIRNSYSVNVPLIILTLGIEVKYISNPGYDAACYGNQPIIWLNEDLSENCRRFMMAQMLYYVLNGKTDEVFREHYWASPLNRIEHAKSWTYAAELLGPSYIISTLEKVLPISPVKFVDWFKALYDKNQRELNEKKRQENGFVVRAADILGIPVGAFCTMLAIRHHF